MVFVLKPLLLLLLLLLRLLLLLPLLPRLPLLTTTAAKELSCSGWPVSALTTCS